MSLLELSIQHVRSVASATLQLSPGLNLITGQNGAGKTSILESVFLLGRGRSFRTRISERLISHGAEELQVFGRSGGDHPHAVGVGVSRAGGTLARLDGATPNSLAELSGALPVQVLDPDIHKLLEEGSARRRRFLDWSVFHVEPGFADAWLRYTRALRQRNAALRVSASGAGVWDTELARYGELVAAARQRVFIGLLPFWEAAFAEMLGRAVQPSLQGGWDKTLTLIDALSVASARDRERRISTVGPHRADLVLRVDGRPARDVLSRGQQKLAAAALILGQLEFLRQEVQLQPTLLLDDPAAELDADRLEQLVERVRRLDTQLIVTSLSPELRAFGRPEAVFHVEQGGVSRV